MLGTAFNIEAYTGETNVRISLVRGKVAVEKDAVGHEPITQLLMPGEMLSLEKNTNLVRKEQLLQLDIEQWTKGYMIFNDVPLADALHRVAQRYQLQVKYAKGVQPTDSRITTLLKEGALNELTQLLPFITPYQCRIQGKVIYVSKKESAVVRRCLERFPGWLKIAGLNG